MIWIQVVLSTEGKIVGFQPTSLVAVNHWSANPLAKELYGGKELSPGMYQLCSYFAPYLADFLHSENNFILRASGTSAEDRKTRENNHS